MDRPGRGLRGRAALVALLAVAGCKATTTRPTFVPFPEAASGEIGLGQPDRDSSVVRVARTLASALAADSIPLARVHEIDGYLDSGWFDAKTLKPSRARPLGPDVVRVRAWVDPGKPGYSHVEVETVYVPVADPSRPPRELEAPAPADHPVAKRVAALVKDLVLKYGDPADRDKLKAAPGGPPLKETKTAPKDTTGAKPGAPAARPPAVRPKPASPRDTTIKRDTTVKRDTSGLA